MSYGLFLAIFLGAPIAALLVATRIMSGRLLLVLTGTSLLALAYTTPWDNLIISRGVWTYGQGRVLGVLVGHVPLEECAFYVLQVFLVGMVTALIVRRAA
jgi:lycopene cyclase domain-containing protein